jgi:recombination associated protein RdgC
MWFRNLHVFHLEQDWTLAPGALEEALARHPLTPCPAMSMQSNGWVAPTEEPALVQSLERQMLIALGTEQKLLPSAVINDAAKAKAIEWEKQRGFKPGRKLIREFKDRAAAELLPRAFVRRRSTRAWIDPAARRIVVDAASPARAEDLISHLRDALGELNVSLPQPEASPGATMTAWLAADQAPGRFALGEECELSGKEENKPVVRYLRHPLQATQLRRHFDEGFKVSRLALVWNSRISLLASDKLLLKRVNFLDIDEERKDEAKASPEQQFETDFALMTGEYSALLSDLLDAFGARPAAA